MYGGEEINLMSGTAEAGGQMARNKKVGQEKAGYKKRRKTKYGGFWG